MSVRNTTIGDAAKNTRKAVRRTIGTTRKTVREARIATRRAYTAARGQR